MLVCTPSPLSIKDNKDAILHLGQIKRKKKNINIKSNGYTLVWHKDEFNARITLKDFNSTWNDSSTSSFTCR